MRFNLDHILKILLFLFLAGITIYIWGNPDRYQWDFDTYYGAAQAYSQGANPYDFQELSQFQRVQKNLNFVYPPITLFIFRSLLAMDYDLAYHLFLALKCLLLIGLLFLWQRYFLRDKFDSLYVLFCLFGFGGAILLDLAAGNISLVEQFLLWSAFYYFLNRRMIPFGLLIVAAAIFKIVPVLFLFLLLLVEDRKKYLYFATFLGLFALLFLSSYLIAPALFIGFIQNLFRFSDIGVVNPSNLSLFSGFFLTLGKLTGVAFPSWIALIPFLIIVVVILAVSLRAFKALKNGEIGGRDLVALFLACLVYALVLPRFKDYSYILLLAPAYFIIKRVENIGAFPFIFALTIISSARFEAMPGLNIIYKAFWSYYPLFLAYMIWALYLNYIFVQMKRSPSGAR